MVDSFFSMRLLMWFVATVLLVSSAFATSPPSQRPTYSSHHP